MLNVTDPAEQPSHGAEPVRRDARPELTRRGFILTYPMFRYWGKEQVADGMKPAPLNLYVHMPYCIQRCAYCYFKTTTLKENRLQEIDRYVLSVCREIELGAQRFQLGARPVETVYFGGGTPSLMSEDNIDRLFATLRANFTFANPQITFEGEPVTLTPKKAAILQRNGVNRISLGIQSFKEEVVFQTGRRDTLKQTFDAIALAKDTGAQVNIDLISGLGGETPETWAYSVERAIESAVHNITIYKLELYANTPYYSAERQHQLELPSDEQELEFIRYAAAELKRHGYKPINTFTWAKDGAYDQLNTRSKWTGNDNYAVGVSAFGNLGRWNYQNMNDIPGYTETVERGELPAFRSHTSTSFEVMARDAVLGIKLINLDHLRFQKKHGFDLRKACATELAELEEEGFVTVDDRHISLTDEGILYGDHVARVLEGALQRMTGAGAGTRARVLF
jgi:oxygen-independent coproporphyrinogen-3 oxidase